MKLLIIKRIVQFQIGNFDSHHNIGKRQKKKMVRTMFQYLKIQINKLYSKVGEKNLVEH